MTVLFLALPVSFLGAPDLDVVETTRIETMSPHVGQNHGEALALDGDTLLVGAPGDNALANGAGAVHVYRRQGVEWLQEARLTASDGAPEDAFGSSVSVNGDLAVVGAPGDASGRGSVYVFARAGGVWQELGKLTASDGASGDRFGAAVAVDGDLVVVGAPFADPDGIDSAGAVYVFVRELAIFVERQKIVASDAQALVELGTALALDGTTLLAGAPGPGFFGFNLTGTGYLYEYNAGTQTFGAEVKLDPPNGDPLGEIGDSVALVGDVAILCAPSLHGAYAFHRAGGAWDYEAFPYVQDAGIGTGLAHVSFDGEHLLLGLSLAPPSLAGRVYLFHRDGSGVWTRDSDFAALDTVAGDRFGTSTAVDGEWGVVGTPFVDDGFADAGAAYAFHLAPPGPGTAVCFGDGSGTPCPCGNAGGPAEGCAHSAGHGMRIAARGAASITSDDLSLLATRVPHENSGIFYVGANSLDPGAPLYDGLQCAGGDSRRFAGRFQAAGAVEDTGFVAQDPSGVYFAPGVTYYFQYWTRDVAGGASPCGTGANFSPAYAVTMTP